MTPPDGDGDDLDPPAWLEAAGTGAQWQLHGPIDVLPPAAAAEAHDAVVPSVADLTPYLKPTMAAVRARTEAVKKGHHANDPLLSDVIPGGALTEQLARVEGQLASLHLRFGVPPQPAQELYEDARPLGSAGSAASKAAAGGDAASEAGSSVKSSTGKGVAPAWRGVAQPVGGGARRSAGEESSVRTFRTIRGRHALLPRSQGTRAKPGAPQGGQWVPSACQLPHDAPTGCSPARWAPCYLVIHLST